MFLSKIIMKIVAVVLMFVIKVCYIINAENFDVVVAQDGSGNYKTISEAVLAAPNYSTTRYNIKIKAGVYNELVKVGKEKTRLSFIGDGADVTIINGNRGTGYTTEDTSTVLILGNQFIATDISFNNSAGPGIGNTEGPAVAMRSEGNNLAFYKCNFDGYQDTLNVASGYQFFRECNISGSTDFIFGGAAVVFQSCNILIHNKPEGDAVITAQSKQYITAPESGISFHKCSVKGAGDFDRKLRRNTFLGRPWSNNATVVFMESFLDGIINPQGWLAWPQYSNCSTSYYGEYRNYGHGARTKARVNWENPRKMTHKQAQLFTVRNFIFGDSWLKDTGIPFDLDLTK